MSERISSSQGAGTPSFYLLDAQGKIQGTGVGVSDLAQKLEALSNRRRR
jgi:hypothetical protein